MGQIPHLRTIQRSFTPNSATPFIARFVLLEPIRRESPSLNSCNSLNSLNSFSCHVDR
jgi:hypothetical protein